jgi:undecaprenyl pyrophosphate synthase
MAGHRDGFAKLKEVLDWCTESGVEEVSAYAFSYDNWNRSEEEVSTLMELFTKALDSEDLLSNKSYKIKIIGNLLHPRIANNDELLHKIENLESRTSDNSDRTLNILFSYSGAEDIKNLKLNGKLLSEGISDLDLVIRTGGNRRLSDFLPLQSAYAELYFTDTLWPELGRSEFDSILSDFAKIKINKGK